jgi:hypothetical protein
MNDPELENLQLQARLIRKMEDSKGSHDVLGWDQNIFAFR